MYTPPRTKYSPVNVEILQKVYSKRLKALNLLIEASNRDRSEASTVHFTFQEKFMWKLVQRNTPKRQSTQRTRARNALLQELELLRRAITSHPIQFIPMEILIDIFSYLVDEETSFEAKMGLVQVCRYWESIVLNYKRFWAYVALPHQSLHSDLERMLAGQVPISLFLDSRAGRELIPEYLGALSLPVRSLTVEGATELFLEPRNHTPTLAALEERHPNRSEATTIWQLPLSTVQELVLPGVRHLISLAPLENMSRLWALVIWSHTGVATDSPMQSVTLPNLKHLELDCTYLQPFTKALEAPRLSTLLAEIPKRGSSDQHALSLILGFPVLWRIQFVLANSFDWSGNRHHNPEFDGIWVKNASLTGNSQPAAVDLPEGSFELNSSRFDSATRRHFTELSLLLYGDYIGNIYLPMVSVLHLRSKGTRTTVNFIEHLFAPELKVLTLRCGEDQEREFCGNCQELQVLGRIEILQIFPEASIPLVGSWDCLWKLEIPIEPLRRSRKIHFPRLRHLKITGPLLDEVSFDELVGYKFDLENIETFSLQVRVKGVNFTHFPRAKYLELPCSELLDELVDLLFETPLWCAQLQTLVLLEYPTKWEELCAILQFRAQASIIGTDFTPISSVMLPFEPPVVFLEPLLSSLKGNIYLPSDWREEQAVRMLSAPACIWCSKEYCLQKHRCFRRKLATDSPFSVHAT